MPLEFDTHNAAAAQVWESDRVQIYAIDEHVLIDLLDGQAAMRWVPEGGVIQRVWHDPGRRAICCLVSHPGFERVPTWAPAPFAEPVGVRMFSAAEIRELTYRSFKQHVTEFLNGDNAEDLPLECSKHNVTYDRRGACPCCLHEIRPDVPEEPIGCGYCLITFSGEPPERCPACNRQMSLICTVCSHGLDDADTRCRRCDADAGADLQKTEGERMADFFFKK